MDNDNKYKRRPFVHWAALLLFIACGTGSGGWALLTDPDTPLDPAWNPTQPLRVTERITPLTAWKLRRALEPDAQCLAALQTGARFQRLDDLSAGDRCGINPRVRVSSLGTVNLNPVETRCQTALRLAMWTEHGLRPTTQKLLGTNLTRIEHFSSYNCRAMRTGCGETIRMSTLQQPMPSTSPGSSPKTALASALRATGTGDDPKATFLGRANATSCDRFRVTLEPDYNGLHADQFY